MKANWGEQQAKAYLERQGLSIIAQNYHTRYGEIDMIAADAAYIIFVEVKMRKSKRFALAREHVTLQKQQKILLAAQGFMLEKPDTRQPRFDVLEVYGDAEKDRLDEIIWLQDAFGG